jgi:uncharacterized protein YaaN involved in tellurite resistance
MSRIFDQILKETQERTDLPTNEELEAACAQYWFEECKALQGINQTLRDQVKQFEKIPGLKGAKEEISKLNNLLGYGEVEQEKMSSEIQQLQQDKSELMEAIQGVVKTCKGLGAFYVSEDLEKLLSKHKEE